MFRGILSVHSGAITELIILLYLACNQPGPTPEPTPAPESPPTAAAVVVPGTYLADGFPLSTGQEVLALCDTRLERVEITVERDADQITPSVPCAWQAILGGVGDRVGDGSIRAATIQGDPSMEPPATVRWGPFEVHIHGRVDSDTHYVVELQADDRQELVSVDSEAGVRPRLIWAGDLDNDHSLDWIIDTPTKRNESHLRLYLTAKQSDGRPELVAESHLKRKP